MITETKIRLSDQFQGYAVEYTGMLRYQWDANRIQLIPLLPGDSTIVQLVDLPGLNIKARSGYTLQIKFVNLTYVEVVGTTRRFVLKCAVYLLATNTATTEETVLDRWPVQSNDGWFIEYASGYLALA